MKKILLVLIALITFFNFCTVNAKNEIKIDQEIKNDKLLIVLKLDTDNPVLAVRFKLDFEEYISNNLSVKALNNFTLTKAKYYVLDRVKNSDKTEIIEFEIPYNVINDDNLELNMKELSYSDGKKTYQLNDFNILIKGIEEKKLENEVVEIEIQKDESISETNKVNNPHTGEIIPLVFFIALNIMIIYVVYKIKNSKKFYQI